MEVYMAGDTAAMNSQQIILPQYLEKSVVIAPDAFSKETMQASIRKATILGTASALGAQQDAGIQGVREHSGVTMVAENHLMVVYDSRFVRKIALGFVGVAHKRPRCNLWRHNVSPSACSRARRVDILRWGESGGWWW